MDATPQPSATVVLIRDGAQGPQVLLVQRSERSSSHGGAWAFPGGRVDPEDRLAIDGNEATGVARRAAVRELGEEVRIEADPETLVWLSRWTTPTGRPKRFLTWFFLARDAGAAARIDGVEITDAWWASPAEAIEARQLGRIALPPPTFVTLSRLLPFASAAMALEQAAGADPLEFAPRLRRVGEKAVSLYAEDAAYEGEPLDAPGRRHRLKMDSAAWRYECRLEPSPG